MHHERTWKSAVLMMKKSKMQSWENFSHKQDSNYWQADKCSKHQNAVLLGNGKNILGRRRDYFKDLSNLATITPPKTHEVRGRNIPSLQPKSPMLSKHWRLQDVMKSDLKCSKPCIDEKFFDWRIVCQMAWRSVTEILAHWVITTIRKKGVSAPTTGAYLTLAVVYLECARHGTCSGRNFKGGAKSAWQKLKFSFTVSWTSTLRPMHS